VLADALRLIEELVGKQAQTIYEAMHRADVTHTRANIEQAREKLGWAPQTIHQDGIRKTVEWRRSNRDQAREIRTV